MGGAIMAAGAAAIDAFGVEPSNVQVTRHDLLVPQLPRALEGLVVAHVTDVHLPRGMAAAQRTIELLAIERPDVVLLGGDMAEGAAAAPALAAFARSVRGTLATAAVMGNWEYASGLGLRRTRAAYRQAGVPLLINDGHVLEVGDARLGISGFDDVIWGSPDLRRGAAAARDAEIRIWLVHEPVLVDTVPASVPAPDLVLAGHTHGGQVRLPLIGKLVVPPGSGRYVQGWYRGGAAPLYVTRGIGTSGINVRFLCRPELALFTLRRASDATSQT